MPGRLPSYFRLDEYGISAEDIVQMHFHCSPERIQSKVVLMPAWDADIFGDVADSVEDVAAGVWEVRYHGQPLTVIRSGIGAPMAGDAVLALGCTPCVQLIFVGSFASLRKDVNIGDLLVVDHSVCGDGYSRYLGRRVKPADCFLSRSGPDRSFTERVGRRAAEVCHGRSVDLHHGSVISIDCVLPEFFRLNYFDRGLGCTGLEMETAAVFRAARLVRIQSAALLMVSDNPVQQKCLYTGRTAEDQDRRRFVRRQVLARAVLESLTSVRAVGKQRSGG